MAGAIITIGRNTYAVLLFMWHEEKASNTASEVASVLFFHLLSCKIVVPNSSAHISPILFVWIDLIGFTIPASVKGYAWTLTTYEWGEKPTGVDSHWECCESRKGIDDKLSRITHP